MKNTTMSSYHTVDDEWLASYCGGGLSTAKRFLIDCQASINPQLSNQLDTMDTVGGVLLEAAKGETLSDGFMSRIFENLDAPRSPASSEPQAITQNDGKLVSGWGPKPLVDFFKRASQPLQWRNMGFGVSRLSLMEEGREKLYLLKARPGLKMPVHTHHGEEWALILQGGYHVGDMGYARGDLHREDETCTHQPIIDDHGEACITLVASEGGLKFSNPLLRMLNPLLGI